MRGGGGGGGQQRLKSKYVHHHHLHSDCCMTCAPGQRPCGPEIVDLFFLFNQETEAAARAAGDVSFLSRKTRCI